MEECRDAMMDLCQLKAGRLEGTKGDWVGELPLYVWGVGSAL